MTSDASKRAFDKYASLAKARFEASDVIRRI